jgi:uncharacterized protein
MNASRSDVHRPVALITGASSGIGEAFARRLARDGHDLILVARRKERLSQIGAELQNEHDTGIEVHAADLTLDRDVEKLVTLIEQRSALSFLVNSAGFGTRGHFAEVEADKSENMVRVHVLANVRLTRAALPAMIEQGRGAVINVSSLGAFFTTAHYTTYAATKSYLNMFTEGLAAELAGTGVRVQALCPGLTRTGFMYTPEFTDFHYEKVPAFAWMDPEQVVDQSMSSMGKGPVVFIPGVLNRMFVRILTAPVAGRLVGGAINLLSRGREPW